MQVYLTIPNHKTLCLGVSDIYPLEDLKLQVTGRIDNVDWDTVYITGQYGLSAEDQVNRTETPWFTLQKRLRGGKGGFGSMLRSQGNKMASKKPANYDDCRDLSGRRIKTLKEAKGIVDRIDSSEKTRAEAAVRRRAKIAEGLKDRPMKHLFDDRDYTRDCEEIVKATKRNTRNALKETIRKRRKAEPKAASRTGIDSDRNGEAGASPSPSSSSSAVVPSVMPLFDEPFDDFTSDSDSGSDSNSKSEPEPSSAQSEPEPSSAQSANGTVADKVDTEGVIANKDKPKSG